MGNLEQIEIERLRVSVPTPRSATTTERSASPRRNRRTQFLPEVEWTWFCHLPSLPGKAGWVALALYRLATMRKKTVLMVNCRELADELGVNRKAVYHAMDVLAADGVIRCERGRGSLMTVELLVMP